MLYVYYGSGEEAVRAAAYAKLAALTAETTSHIHRLEPDTYEVGQVIHASQGVALFGGPQVYLIDTPSLREEFFAEVSVEVAALAASIHHFVIIEGPLTVALKKDLATAATLMTEYKSESKERFDTFTMADALAKKDKRTLWILLQEASREGLPAEEIIGVLWWQLKTMRLALLTKTAAEAGVKEFPYNKAKRSLTNFKPGELANLSHSLLLLYHDGHTGKCDINVALEEWVLRM